MVKRETGWGKVNNAFIQHLIDQHPVRELVDALYLVASDEALIAAGDTDPDPDTATRLKKWADRVRERDGSEEGTGISQATDH